MQGVKERAILLLNLLARTLIMHAVSSFHACYNTIILLSRAHNKIVKLPAGCMKRII